MSLHSSDWKSIIEEIKQDLPWLMDLWHQVKTADPETLVHQFALPGIKSGNAGEEEVPSAERE